MSEQQYRLEVLAVVAKFAIAISIIILSIGLAIQAGAIRDLQHRVGELEQRR